MGLIRNLQVLCTSDIGDQVRELRMKYEQLVTEVQDALALSEVRYRRLSKRLRDDHGESNGEQAPANDRVQRLLARRAARRAPGVTR